MKQMNGALSPLKKETGRRTVFLFEALLLLNKDKTFFFFFLVHGHDVNSGYLGKFHFPSEKGKHPKWLVFTVLERHV